MIDTTQPSKTGNLYKIAATILAILITVGIIVYRDSFNQFKELGYLGIFLFSLIGNATVLMPVPILVTIAAMGTALNPLLVGLFGSLGAAIGESVGYFLGLSGNILLEKSTRYHQAKAYINRYGAWAILVLAALPNPLFDLAGIMAGAAGISFPQFFIAAWIGTFIKYTLIAGFGSGIAGW